MKKNLLTRTLLIIAFGFSNTIFGQIAGGIPNINGIPNNIPSPNAASLGQYEQVPVNLFNGLTDIRIPLFKGDNLDINLSYYASGVRPDQHSGWVGVGWTLNAGGAITRIVNGGVDEYYNPDNSVDPTKWSYYDNYNVLDGSDWLSTNRLYGYIEGTDNFGLQTLPVPYPDEFVFNFNGISGSFYYNHKGKWVVKSEQAISIKVEEELKYDYVLKEYAKIFGTNPDYHEKDRPLERIFYGFTLTTQDGTKYVFGKTDNSIEFGSVEKRSSNVLWYDNITANTWYLTKIITPNNKEINFVYERDYYAVFKPSVSLRKGAWDRTSDGIYQSDGIDKPHVLNVQKNYLTYLREITSDSYKITFNKSLSNELRYSFVNPSTGENNLIGGPGISGWVYDEPQFYETYSCTSCPEKYENMDHFYKLDNFTITNLIGEQINKYEFDYRNNLNSRLFLESIHEFGNSPTSSKTYIFDYNYDVPLPVYNSREVDHWGFYNHTAFSLIDYYNRRNPDPYYMKAGMLTKITYPTGGFSSFEYEPHKYSLVVDKEISGGINFGVKPVSEAIAGGLRIKSITSNYDDPGALPVTKEYYYVNDYLSGDMTPSGILDGMPVYIEDGVSPLRRWNGSQWVEDGSITFYFWNSYSIEPMSSTNGSHITYSKVVERIAGDGFTEYSYSNHDQAAYQDQKMLVAGFHYDGEWKNLPFSNKSIERGKLLNVKTYDEGQKLVSEVINTYSSLPDPDDNSIRAMFIKSVSFGGPSNTNYAFANWATLVQGTSFSIFNIDKYFKYLSKKEEITYNDLSGPITNTTLYSYNYNRLLTENQLIGSKGEVLKTQIKYPEDFATSELFSELMPEGVLNEYNVDNVYKTMVNRHILDKPIEVIKKNEEEIISATINEFIYPETVVPKKTEMWETNLSTIGYVSPYTLYAPDNSSCEFIVDGRMKTKVTFDKYDSNKNLLQYHLENGMNTAFIWGYNKEKLIAKINNASHDDISGYETSLQELSDLDFDENSEQNLRNALNALRSEPVLSNAMITTYTYDPLVGVTSITDPKGYTSFYTYDHFNRLKFIKEDNGDVLKEFSYHYKGEGIGESVGTYTVSNIVNGNYGYVISPNSVDEGGNVQVMISPFTGYEVTSIKINGISHAITTSFTINNIMENILIDVEFSLKSYTVSTVIDGGVGTIDSVSPSTVIHGGNVTINLTPSTGYEVQYVKVGSISYTITGNSAVISNVSSDIVINVKFNLKTYSVSSTVDGGSGSVTLSPESHIYHGSDLTVILSPSTGYAVEYVKVGGTSYTVTNNQAIIPNITANTVVNVKFSQTTVLNVTPLDLMFLSAGVHETITVTSNVLWSVSRSDSFINISSYGGSGNGSFTVSVTNVDGTPQTGTVTVTGGGMTKTIFVEFFP